jgi:hypothetical protein
MTDNTPEPVDLQRFVEYLRQALVVPDSVPKEELARWLAEYGKLVEEVNSRLRECLLLIQRGQDANAMALANREPRLLPLCVLLDLSERELLAAAAAYVNATAPATIKRQLVDVLQDADLRAAAQSPNRALLHKLTLVHAPLPTRLSVMRQLLVLNPNHPYLDADIRTFERAWFKQALAFVARYAAEGRTGVLEEALFDLEQSGYYETPPASLVTLLKTKISEARLFALPALAGEIRAAFERPTVESL